MKVETNIEFNTIKSLENNPSLKKLLIDYCLIQYEENAIIDEEHLIKEYNYLQKHNKLHELFECEMLCNYFKEESAKTQVK